MNWDISQFHFIRPIWLSLLPVMVLLWWFARKAVNSGAWESYLPKPMLEALRVNASKGSTRWQWWLLASWLILTFAAAGPTWIKQPVPIVKNQKAMVVALDLSPSMLADDVTPNRLTLAKYKLIDILRKQSDGQVALIAYAGDAHTVSPLTDDPTTIEALLPALHPNVMPVTGSNTEAAIVLAQTLFKDAGVSSGEILLITDGVSSAAIAEIGNELQSNNTLSILGVGGTQGAPIKLQDGGFLKNSQGEIVLASLNVSDLRSLSQRSGGRYAGLSTNESDINYLLQGGFESADSDESVDGNTSFDSWLDLAHFLVILLLPIALFCFRKGLIYVLPLTFLLPLESEAAWSNLWKTKDQQAQQLLEKEQYAEAAKTFERRDWSAIASFRDGDFSQAASDLQNSTDVTSQYNKGNALAFQGELEQALEAYQEVLNQDPTHQDALHNKQVIEALLKQQEQQEQQNSDDQQQGDQDSQSENDQSQSGENQDQQNPQNQQQGSENEDSSSQENQSSSNDQEQQSESQQSPSDESSEEQSSENQQQASSDAEEPSANDEPSADQESSEAAGNEKPSDEEEQQAIAQEQAQTDESAEDGEAGSAQLIESDQTPLKDSSEQWLRTIQDDPSGLLRRKFQYQSQKRLNSNKQSSNRSNEERY